MKSIIKYSGFSFFKKLSGVLLIITMPVGAYANAGVPMIFISYPLMLCSLLPVIIIETIIFSKITEISYEKSIRSSGISNSVSTLAGFPLAWLFLLFIEIVTTGGRCGPGFDTARNSMITVIVEAAWICPWDEQLYWMIPSAFIISLIVAFLISILIEYLINKKIYKEYDRKVIRRATVYSNIFSYGFLLIISIAYLVNSLYKNHKLNLFG